MCQCRAKKSNNCLHLTCLDPSLSPNCSLPAHPNKVGYKVRIQNTLHLCKNDSVGRMRFTFICVPILFCFCSNTCLQRKRLTAKNTQACIYFLWYWRPGLQLWTSWEVQVHGVLQPWLLTCHLSAPSITFSEAVIIFSQELHLARYRFLKKLVTDNTIWKWIYYKAIYQSFLTSNYLLTEHFIKQKHLLRKLD